MPEKVQIPITLTDASFKIRTILEEAQYVLRFDWNERQARWCLSIMDSDEVPLIMGIVLNINNEFLSRFALKGMPPGRMILYDLSGKNAECGRDDIGTRCVLIYENSV